MCNDARVMATLGGTISGAELAARTTRISTPSPDGSAISVIEHNGRFIGYCGLKIIPDDKPAGLRGQLEIAWGLVHAAWGQGFATEAAAAVLAHAKGRIFAYTARINLPSQAVMQRLDLTRRADLDFDNMAATAATGLRPHLVYERPA
jgi:RimJ/RimL family protein N-acetyltransferase